MFGAAAIVDNERCKKGISRKKLTKGLCSQQSLAKSASSGYNLELYLFVMLLERMDLSVDNLEFILSKNEYNKVSTIDKIEEYIISRDFFKARSLLEGYFNQIVKLSPIEKMFYYRITAEIMLYTVNESTELTLARDYAIKAINSTLPGISYENYSEYLYSTYEYENLLLYAKSLCMLNNTEKAFKLLLTIYNHASDTISNHSLLARVIPKCTYLLTIYCKEYIDDSLLIDYLERSIELLRSNYIIYFTEPLLTELISLYTELNNHEKMSYWLTYKNVIADIWNNCYPEAIQDSLLFHWIMTSYHLDYEIIRCERSSQNISQDELSMEIYQSPVSVSRLENAVSSPRKHHYDELSKQLGLNKPRFGGFILTDSFEYLNHIASIRELLGNGRLDDVIKLITETTPKNNKEKSLLCAYHALALISKEKETPDSAKTQIKEYFNKWYPVLKLQHIRKPFQEDADILGVYIYLLSENDPILASEILFKLKNAFDSSDCNPRYNYRSYGSFSILFIRHTISIISDNDITNFMNQSIKYSLSCGKGNEIYSLLWAKIVRERILGQRISIDLEYQSYILADFFHSVSADNKRKFYEKDKHCKD